MRFRYIYKKLLLNYRFCNDCINHHGLRIPDQDAVEHPVNIVLTPSHEGSASRSVLTVDQWKGILWEVQLQAGFF
jgi:hypothetical protein